MPHQFHPREYLIVAAMDNELNNFNRDEVLNSLYNQIMDHIIESKFDLIQSNLKSYLATETTKDEMRILFKRYKRLK